MTATCHRRDHDEYRGVLGEEIDHLASVLDGRDFETAVSTCPGWTLAKLAQHAGGVHRWAGEHVRRLSTERIPARDVDYGFPGEPSEFPAWLRAGGKRLLEILESCNPDAEMWAWGSDHHARFWSRRMLHETTVHRADAELSLGLEPVIDARVAIDGIDELLDNLPHAAFFAPGVDQLRGSGETIALRAPEIAWSIRLEPERFAWEHTSVVDADAVVSADAASLYLFGWGRRALGDAAVKTFGDRDLLARWVQHSQL